MIRALMGGALVWEQAARLKPTDGQAEHEHSLHIYCGTMSRWSTIACHLTTRPAGNRSPNTQLRRTFVQLIRVLNADNSGIGVLISHKAPGQPRKRALADPGCRVVKQAIGAVDIHRSNGIRHAHRTDTGRNSDRTPQ